MPGKIQHINGKAGEKEEKQCAVHRFLPQPDLLANQKQQKKDQKNSGAGWIIWIIVTLAMLFPKLWDFLADWIGTNL